MEAPGVIDLRITRAGWRQVQEHFSGDPAVIRPRATGSSFM
jgi:hypothetical protein